MARAALVSGPRTLGFLLLRGAYVWFWVVLGLRCRLCPATPGWGLRCLRLGFVLGPFPTILGGDFGACVIVCALHLYPAVPSSGERCVCVCLGSGFGCAPPLLGEVLVCVGVCVRTPPGPLHLLAGAAVRGRVLGPGLLPRPATPAWGVWACVCLCAHPACTPSFLAGVCGVGVCGGLGFRLCPASLGVGVCVRSCVCPFCTPPFLVGWCVCVWVWVSFALRFFPGLAAGVRGLLCALHSFPVTFWGAAWGRGGVRVLLWVGFVPPLPFGFFFSAGGGLSWRVVSWLCCVRCWLSWSWVSCSLPPSPLVRAAPSWLFFSFCPRPSEVCVGVFG